MGARAGSELLSAYLVVGTDELKSRAAQTRLKGRLEQGYEAFNLDERVADKDLVPEELLSSLNTLPVGGGLRLVFVTEAEQLAKPTSEAIIKYLEDPNPGCVLCLVAAALAKSTRLYKAVAAVGPRAVIDCTPKKGRGLVPVIQRMAQSQRMRMGGEAAEELLGRVGESTTMLESQVRSLAALKASTGEITLQDVREHIARTAEVKPWDFLDAVSARGFARAIELYGLMGKPSQIALVSLLEVRLRELACARSLELRGEASQLAKTLGRPPWALRGHLGWARRFGSGELERSLVACARCERELKGGRDVETSFLRLVSMICGVSSDKR